MLMYHVIDIKLPQDPYAIWIGNDQTASWLKALLADCRQRKIAIITDSTVDTLYTQKIQDDLSHLNCPYQVIVLPAGEIHKTFESVQHIYQKLAEFQLQRRDLVIAFGGGVVGDLSGFAASTYLRGVDYWQIPTTIISQVDSSIGGKTGYNLPQGKNLVGTFCQPKQVLIDLHFLKTLTSRDFRSGLAEIIKHGLIADQELFSLIPNTTQPLTASDSDLMTKLIIASLHVKRRLVEQDVFETGPRRLLNFGHTFGHGIEQAGGYQIFNHGEAIGIGMIVATLISISKGHCSIDTLQFVIDQLKRQKLPHENRDIDWLQVFQTVKQDKKSEASEINFVLLKTIGTAFVEKISLDELKFVAQKLQNIESWHEYLE